MMIKIFLPLLFLTTNLQAEVVIGTVNIQKVLDSIKQGKKVTSQLKKSYDNKKKKINT